MDKNRTAQPFCICFPKGLLGQPKVQRYAKRFAMLSTSGGKGNPKSSTGRGARSPGAGEPKVHEAEGSPKYRRGRGGSMQAYDIAWKHHLFLWFVVHEIARHNIMLLMKSHDILICSWKNNTLRSKHFEFRLKCHTPVTFHYVWCVDSILLNRFKLC